MGCRILLCCLLFLGTLAFAAPARFVPAVPEVMVYYGTDMVPLQYFARVIGASETVRNGLHLFTFRKHTFACTTGRKGARANGVALTLPQAPRWWNGELLVPLESLVSALGGTVSREQNEAGEIAMATIPGAGAPYRMRRDPYLGRDIQAFDYFEQYAMRIDGSGLMRLTYNQYEDLVPNLSPDGKLIACYHPENLYLRSIADPRERLLSTASGTRESTTPSFSPNSRLVLYRDYYREAGEVWITRINIDGTDKYPVAEGDYGQFLPDGTTIAYTRCESNDPDLWKAYLIDRDGKNQRRVGDALDFSLSPNGKMLVASRIFKQDIPGDESSFYELTLDTYAIPVPHVIGRERKPTINESFGSFSPDGKRIAFTRHGRGIYTMNNDRSMMRRLTRGRRDFCPTFTADGQSIFFLRNNVLYRMRANGSAQVRLASKLFVSATDLRLSPDGRYLLFSAMPVATANSYGLSD